MKTLRAIHQEVKAKLEKVSIEEADQDARLMIIEAFNLSPMAFALEADKILEEDGFEVLDKMVHKRCLRIPVSQIFGEKEFWSLSFKVTADTLTPRPDSETLIEAALKNIENKNDNYRILDLGTGTGCLLLSLLSELSNATGVGVDISPDTLKVATENAKSLGFDDRSEFLLSDWFSSVRPLNDFDIIISNPPYIGYSEKAVLAPEVKDHEPEQALFSGEEGLDDYRLIAQKCAAFLKRNGMIILEIGYKQARDVKKIFISAGFNTISLYQDLAGRDRCLIFRK